MPMMQAAQKTVAWNWSSSNYLCAAMKRGTFFSKECVMRIALNSPSLRRLPALLAFTLLAACGKPANDSAVPVNPQADSQASADGADAKDLAESTAKCEGNPLLKAMPPKATIGDLPFWYWDCTFNSVRAVYGKDGDKQMDITLTDTRSPDIDKQPAMIVDMLTRAAETTRAMTQVAVQGYVETRKALEQEPAMLQAIGGPEYLPVIETAPSGEPIVIHVGTKGDPSDDAVSAVLKDRYVLVVQASDKNGSAGGMTGPQAQALYEPYLKQMHLEQLQ